MKKDFTLDCVIPLTEEEITQIDGGFLPILLAAAEVYLVICGLATAAGAATAYIQNKL